MAGIMHKIEEKFKGGKKEDEKHGEYKGEGHAQFVKPQHGYGEHKPERKEGFADKVKGKVHGEGGKEKKKKKGGKNKKHGDSSSSSDSD